MLRQLISGSALLALSTFSSITAVQAQDFPTSEAERILNTRVLAQRRLGAWLTASLNACNAAGDGIGLDKSIDIADENLITQVLQGQGGIEDQINQYKQKKKNEILIERERKKADIDLSRIEEANRIVIRNSPTSAQPALQAFANYILAKQKGDNEINTKRKEAQIDSRYLASLVNLDREVAKLRISLLVAVSQFSQTCPDLIPASVRNKVKQALR